MTISLRYAARSSVGLVRASNQDSGYAGPYLLAMCDGMGGPAGGDIASAVAISHLVGLDTDSHQAGELLGLLREAIQEAHADLAARSAADPDLAGLGTTCIAVMRSGNKLGMVHVGDSRAYLLRDGELTQVTTDHTLVEYLIETGRLTREQARQHPQRSVLLRVLGDAEGDIQLDESLREAVPGDRWLLCSDGLSGPVTAATIAEVLGGVADPDLAADQLVDLAERAGGPDNITAIVFDVVDDAASPQTEPQIVGSAALHRERLDAHDSLAAPTSPAAKAAALVAGLEDPSAQEDLDDPHTPTADEDPVAAEVARIQAGAQRRRRWYTIVASLAGVLALVAAAVVGYMWTQTQYYVTTTNDKVAIYQGIPQSLGPISLNQLVQTYDEPAVADLDERMRERLADTVSQPSLSAAQEYVRQTVASRVRTTDPSRPTVAPTANQETQPASTSAPSSTATPADITSTSGQ